MQASRVGALLLALAVVGGGLSMVPVAAADARVTLTDTTVTPATPTAGAPITATTTVRLSAGSDTPLTLEDVRVLDSDGDRLGRARDLGRISPGETLSVPVTFTVEEPAVYDLTLRVRGTDADGNEVSASRPLSVGVERGAPLVELRNATLVADADNTLSTVVSNPTTAPLRNVEVRVTDPASGEQLRRTIPSLAAGAATELSFAVRPTETGERDLSVRTRYTDPTGTTATATHSRSVTVAPLTDDVGVRARPASPDDDQSVPDGIAGLVGGGGSALQQQSDDADGDRALVDVTVTNFGNAPIERVVLTVRSPDGTTLASVGRFTVADRLQPGESTTVRTDLTDVRGVDGVRFVADYRLGGTRADAAVAYDYTARSGNATVTGADVTLDTDGRLRIDGNLANTGTGEVRSAVVRVVPTDDVRPAYPQRSYFVGTVAASEFAPFELTAQADVGNASRVTVEIRYATDGGGVTRQTTLPVPEAERDGTAGDTDRTLLVGVGALVLLAGALAAVVWRRRR